MNWCPENPTGDHDPQETLWGHLVCRNCSAEIEVLESRPIVPPQATEEPTHHARLADPETSKQAAWLNPGRRNGQRSRLAEALIGSEGMTWDRAAAIAGVSAKSSPWRRMTELVARGIAEVVGTAKSTSNANASVYRLTEAGRRVMTQ